MNIKVLLVNSSDGDWEQLWVDGKLMEANHMLSARQVLESLQKAIPDCFELRFEEADLELQNICKECRRVSRKTTTSNTPEAPKLPLVPEVRRSGNIWPDSRGVAPVGE